jgi:hypothetical protein
MSNTLCPFWVAHFGLQAVVVLPFNVPCANPNHLPSLTDFLGFVKKFIFIYFLTSAMG